MRNHFFRIVALVVGCAVVSSVPSVSNAAPLAGIKEIMVGSNESKSLGGTSLSGINLMMVNALTNATNPVESVGSDNKGDETPEKKAPELPEIDYEHTAVANVSDYANVRNAPGEDGERVGKMYKNCVGTVLGAENGWIKIKSGNVEGYVRADFLIVGDKDLIDSVAMYRASISADALKLRSEMSTDSSVLDVARQGEKLDIIDDDWADDGWIEIKRGDTEAYVSSDYVDFVVEFDYAESRAEEEARLAAEARAIDASNASAGVRVANYGLKFVGNPYVWGGTSLTRGADCSGFVMSVYANFGIGLPHSSAADRHVGRAVPINQADMRPGDIVCYSGHVAIYIGGGQIVHAASKRSGIKVSNAFYRKPVAVRRIF